MANIVDYEVARKPLNSWGYPYNYAGSSDEGLEETIEPDIRLFDVDDDQIEVAVRGENIVIYWNVGEEDSGEYETELTPSVVDALTTKLYKAMAKALKN